MSEGVTHIIGWCRSHARTPVIIHDTRRGERSQTGTTHNVEVPVWVTCRTCRQAHGGWLDSAWWRDAKEARRQLTLDEVSR